MTLEILTLLNSCNKDYFNSLQLFPSTENFVSALSVVRFCVGKGTRVRGSCCKLRFAVNSTFSVQENVYVVIRLPYFSIDKAHLMYNVHPKFFRHSF
jgi:hypothetical protein